MNDMVLILKNLFRRKLRAILMMVALAPAAAAQQQGPSDRAASARHVSMRDPSVASGDVETERRATPGRPVLRRRGKPSGRA